MRNLIQKPPGLKLENRDEVRRIDQRLVFTTLFRRETAFVGPFSEGIDTFLHRWINAKIDETTGGLRVEAPAQGVQESI